MTHDQIAEVRIDEEGRLCVVPASDSFPYIYREAMEVHWDNNGRFLYSPKPREWSYVRWFQQILAAAREQSSVLRLTSTTKWSRVPESLRAEMEAIAQQSVSADRREGAPPAER